MTSSVSIRSGLQARHSTAWSAACTTMAWFERNVCLFHLVMSFLLKLFLLSQVKSDFDEIWYEL